MVQFADFSGFSLKLTSIFSKRGVSCLLFDLKTTLPTG